MSNSLHQILLARGYHYTHARQMPDGLILNNKSRRRGYYIKDYDTQAGDFKVALIIWKDPHIELPTACVIELPKSLKNLLIPHISLEGILCYVEQMEADWDPNNLDGIYCEVDEQIKKTLDNAVSSALLGKPDDRELEGEFTAYWRPDDSLHLLSTACQNKELETRLSESTWHDGSPRLEYISIKKSENDESSNTIVRWLSQRNLDANSLSQKTIATHFIHVTPARLAGVTWPPSSFKDILNWLAQVDHNARNRLIALIVMSGMKRHVFLLDIFHQDTIAIYVELNTNIIDLKRLKKSKSQKTVNLAAMFGGKGATTLFKRLGVRRADLATLLSRNSSRKGVVSDMSDKRIALIGCGTIGGYLAELLLRNGAGCGEGYLHLYDDDIYSPHNFGRHVLTARNFGQYKSLSLATRLSDSVHIPTNIDGRTIQFPLAPETFKQYDIVIDSTGRPPVSKRIAAILRKMDSEERPTTIHAFNDGNGRASKVFIDNGNSCYGCMLADPAKYHDEVDMRFLKLDLAAEKFKSCGSTYAAYDAAVSQITAALAQTAILNT